jgi:hypothetical protein
MFMNECIDRTAGRIHVCFDVLFPNDDPRTSWSFQLVRMVGTSLGVHKVGRFLVTSVSRIGNCIRVAVGPNL